MTNRLSQTEMRSASARCTSWCEERCVQCTAEKWKHRMGIMHRFASSGRIGV